MGSESDHSSEGNYPYPEENFLEEYWDQVDCLLAAEEEKVRDLHFSQISLEELFSAQLHDAFCS